MKRIAIFVEGQTEQILLARLLRDYSSQAKLRITSQQLHARRLREVSRLKWRYATETNEWTHEVLLVDVGGEGSVASYIEERQEGLAKEGFSEVIAIRDVYPNFGRHEIGKLEESIAKRFSNKSPAVHLVLGVMEVEAWFLAEHSHFRKIDPGLNVQLISTRLGFDPSIGDMTMRSHPTQDLADAYALVGEQYKKKAKEAHRTAEAIDTAEFFLSLPDKFSHIKLLANRFESFFS